MCQTWVCEGKTTLTDKLEEVTVDIEETTAEVFPGMFDSPVFLTADTEYCMADRMEPGGGGSGFYCNSAKDPSAKVEMDCGITVTYSQVGVLAFENRLVLLAVASVLLYKICEVADGVCLFVCLLFASDW